MSTRSARIMQLATKQDANKNNKIQIISNEVIINSIKNNNNAIFLVNKEATKGSNDDKTTEDEHMCDSNENKIKAASNEAELLIGDITYENNLYDIENMEIFLEDCSLVNSKPTNEKPKEEAEKHDMKNLKESTFLNNKNHSDDLEEINVVDIAEEFETVEEVDTAEQVEIAEEVETAYDPLYEPSFSENNSDRSLIEDDDDGQAGNSNECKENVKSKRPNRGRKRKYPSQDRHARKILKNSNKDHINSRGNQILAKEFLDYKCSCPNKCHENITTGEREQEFQKFWEIADYTAQNAYITTCIQEKPVKRRYKVASESRRNFSRYYTIKKQVVCRELFVKTYGLTTKRINTALVKMRSSSFIDNRGKHFNQRKLDPVTRDSVLNHIRSFPKYKSHYCRESIKGNRQYLSSELNLVKLYELYKASHAEANISFSKYKRIFYDNFNLHFKPLKKDTCNFCDTRNAKLQNEKDEENIKELKKELENHQELASKSRLQMKSDMKEAETNDSIETLTFDLEKTLPLPRIPTNIVFYKRQLWVYNLGIHSSKEKRGNCMVWIEGEAGRGAQEVGSCLRKYIFANMKNGVEELRLWSDSCGGQNRNIKLVLMLQSILQTHSSLQKISFNFLVSGHSFLPNDADFSDIEKALKNQQRIYTPEDYMNVMKSCRKRNKFCVYRLESLDFMSTINLEKNVTNRKIDTSGNKVNWLKMKEICLRKDQPNLLYTRETYDRNTQPNVIDISKKIRGKLTAPRLIPLWPKGKPISEAKLADLKALFSLIPEDAKGFYTNLVADKNIDDDYLDGFNDTLDFNIEEPY